MINWQKKPKCERSIHIQNIFEELWRWQRRKTQIPDVHKFIYILFKIYSNVNGKGTDTYHGNRHNKMQVQNLQWWQKERGTSMWRATTFQGVCQTWGRYPASICCSRRPSIWLGTGLEPATVQAKCLCMSPPCLQSLLLPEISNYITRTLMYVYYILVDLFFYQQNTEGIKSVAASFYSKA